MSIETARNNFLRDFLTDADIACPSCGYNLRNLAGPVCPECGETIILQVGLAEPKVAAAIAGLIGLAAGAGLNGLLVIYAIIRITLMNDGYPGMKRFFMVTGIGLCVESVPMWLWLRYWRAIRRQKPGRKTLLVLAAWMLTLLDLLVFAFNIK